MDIDGLLDELARIIDENDNGKWYLETRIAAGGVPELLGNREGLLVLISHLVGLYRSPSDKAHMHYDEASNLDHCEVELILGRVLAPWDKNSD